MHKRLFWPLLLVVFSFILAACSDEDEEIAVAKPRGYFRIDLPKPQYQQYQEACPFQFRFSKYAVIRPSASKNAQSCWLDIVYPKFNATVYLSYKTITKREDLEKAVYDAYKITFKHTVKASGIEESRIDKNQENVHGLWYEVGGNSASNLQFLLTDSTHHFLHGSLYFYASPNADSVKPVAEFIKRDVAEMIQSFKWK